MHIGTGIPEILPTQIYVEKFKALPVHFQVNRKGKDLNKLIESERLELAQDLVKRLTKYIAPAKLLGAEDMPPRGNYWVVRGSFELVREGSRLLRAGIGLGLGKTTMETKVQVIDLSGRWEEPLLTIKTTGGSGIAPGAAAAFTPIGPFVLSNTLINAGGSVGGALGSGVSIDRRRTAREIVAAISEYTVSHELIPQSRGLHSKQLGKIPKFF